MEFFFTKYGLKRLFQNLSTIQPLYNLYWSLYGKAKTVTQPIYENENISFWSSQWKKDLLVAFCREIQNFLLFWQYTFVFFYIWVLIVFLNNNSLCCNFGLFAHICLFTYRHLSDPALMAQSPGPPSSTHALTLSQSPSFTFGEKLW